jgi:hypothetical protein
MCGGMQGQKKLFSVDDWREFPGTIFKNYQKPVT